MKVVLLGVVAAALLAAAPPAFGGSVVRTYSSGPIGKQIPDRGRLVVPLVVPDPRRIRWLAVRLRIDHPRVADLSVRLVAPDGVVSTLVTHVGGPNGANFGSGRHDCRGRSTTISELGMPSISGRRGSVRRIVRRRRRRRPDRERPALPRRHLAAGALEARRGRQPTR